MITQSKEYIGVFKEKLRYYQQIINEDIRLYSKQVRADTLRQYGDNSLLGVDAFLGILGRGGKRIRGSLVLLGYEMNVHSTKSSGSKIGSDQKMIIEAARAIEMLHAYLLIIDDIQDSSLVRRGGPAAHVILSRYHKNEQLKNDAGHFGLSIGINSALAGMHAAQMILANLDVPVDLRVKVLSIVNRTMMVTIHGQTNDIMNEVVEEVKDENLERVLEWKTAHYTFLNPLHVGMVLAGADCHATDAITEYAIHTGKAFQIMDDITGTFGTEKEVGKNPMDDLREGKRTLLIQYALGHTDAVGRDFLQSMLGNKGLIRAEFERCKEIIAQSGACDYAYQKAEEHIKTALESLEKEKNHWGEEYLQFLIGLAKNILDNQNKYSSN